MRKLVSGMDSAVPGALAWIIQRCLPRSHWYRVLFRISHTMGPAFRLRRRSAWNASLSEAVFVNRVLSLLTRTGKAFPVPWKADGLELLPAYLGLPGGVVICSAHLPLVKMACRAMLDSGIPVAAAITDNPSVTDSMAIWGRSDRMAALQVEPQVLVRVRTLLRAGKVIFLLADPFPGLDFSPSIFHLARRLQSKVFFVSVDLANDGVVLVRFFSPSATEISDQLAELRCEVERIRHRQ